MMNNQGIIGIPRPQRFYAPWEFVESLLNVQHPIISEAGPFIDKNRNKLVERAKNADYLLMIDTDMVFKNEDIDSLEGHMRNGIDIVSGFCKRGASHIPALFKETEGDYEQMLEWGDGLIEVDAVGAAFLMISKKAMDEIKDPFSFITVRGFPQGEDISFCHKARQQGFKIFCDTRIKIGHIRQIIT